MIVLGVMSGSSLDGIDLAIVDFAKSDLSWTWDLVAQDTIPLPASLKAKLSNIVNFKAFELAQTNSTYTAFIGQSINTMLTKASMSPQCIGVHGHTILHLPDHNISWQLLNGGQLTEITNKPVVCDFRNQDMALGGQGTPMAVLCDRDIFPGYGAYINLGGIANISYPKEESWVGYDIVGCNQLLNHFSLKKGLAYDKDGKLAQSGKAIPELLDLLNTDPYLKKSIPKSLDNTYLKNLVKKLEEIEATVEDALCTITQFVASRLAFNIVTSKAKSVLLSGGGTKNKFLIDSIKSNLKGENVLLQIPEENIIDYKESILIAYAALLRWHSTPNFVSSATGATRDVIGGALYIPSKTQING